MTDQVKPNLRVNTKLAMIDDFLIDCVLSEEHTFESEVTEYPVEDGADITDNVRPKPIVVTMECIISNTPLPPIASLRGPRPDGLAFSLLSATRGILQVTPAQEAYQRMLIIRTNRKPVTIRTSLDTFTSMVLKNLTIPRGAGGGDALRFTAAWQQVEIVTNTRGKRVATPSAKGATKKKLPPVPVTTTAPSPLYKVIGVTRLGNFDYLWYDDDIGGWRQGVVHDASSKAGTPGVGVLLGGSTGGVAGVLGTGDADYSTGWVLFKEKPYGATTNQWLTVQSDSFWKAQIAAATDANKNNPLGTGFDPFGDQSANVISDIKLVHAMRR